MRKFDNSQQVLYFLVGCIPVRIVLAALPLYLSKRLLFYYGLVLLGMAISFAYLYFNNGRMNAPEGGGVTWWAKFRIIHSALYLVAAIYALQGLSIAWVPLAIDVVVGMSLFVHQHFLS